MEIASQGDARGRDGGVMGRVGRAMTDRRRRRSDKPREMMARSVSSTLLTGR